MLNSVGGVYLDLAKTITGVAMVPDDYLASHEAVLGALAAHDTDAACAAMTRYLEEHDRRLLAVMGDAHDPPRLSPPCLAPQDARAPGAHHAGAGARDPRPGRERDRPRRAPAARTLPPYLRGGLLAGTATFMVGSAARPSTFGRVFHELDRDQARAYFHSWWESRIFALRQFARGIKGVLAFAYYEEPTVKEQLRYRPDQWIAEAARRRLEKYGAEIERHEEIVTSPNPLIRPSLLTRKVRLA